MRDRWLLLGFVVTVVMGALIGWLLLMSDSTQEPPLRSSLTAARDLSRLVTTSTVELARLKGDPFANFDVLSHLTTSVKQRVRQARVDSASMPPAEQALFLKYLDDLEQRDAHIEHFKSDHAVVRNSARYLPLAFESALELIPASGDPLRPSLVSARNLSDVFLSDGNATAKDSLIRLVPILRRESVRRSPPLSNTLVSVSSHLEVLLNRHQPLEQYFVLATASSYQSSGALVVSSLELAWRQSARERSRYEQSLLSVLIALAAVWLGILVARRGSPAAPLSRHARITPVLTTPVPAPQPFPYPDPVLSSVTTSIIEHTYSALRAAVSGPRPSQDIIASLRVLPPLVAILKRSSLSSSVRSQISIPALLRSVASGPERPGRASAELLLDPVPSFFADAASLRLLFTLLHDFCIDRAAPAPPRSTPVPFTISCAVSSDLVVIDFCDQGPSLSAGDPIRSLSPLALPEHGLAAFRLLSAQAIVVQHGGSLTLDSPPDTPLRIRVQLSMPSSP